jgi:[protein-PII] uridylyltransferase
VALRTLDPGQFFKAKRLEQDQRYTRHDDTPYSLEPNCKESPAACATCS